MVQCEHPRVVVHWAIQGINWRKLAANAVGIIWTAGSPCQDLSSLNVGGLGLEGDRSVLFFDILKIKGYIELVFTDCLRLWFVENVSSMGLRWVKDFNTCLEVTPVFVPEVHVKSASWGRPGGPAFGCGQSSSQRCSEVLVFSMRIPCIKAMV